MRRLARATDAYVAAMTQAGREAAKALGSPRQGPRSAMTPMPDVTVAPAPGEHFSEPRIVADLHTFLRESGGIVGVAEAHPAVTIFELRNGGRLSLWEGSDDYGQRWEIDDDAAAPPLEIKPYERLIPVDYEPPRQRGSRASTA